VDLSGWVGVGLGGNLLQVWYLICSYVGGGGMVSS